MWTPQPSRLTQPSPSWVMPGTSPRMSFYRVRPTSLRFFPVLPTRGDFPSLSFTAAGSYFNLLSLLFKERFFVLRTVLSCTTALWLPTTGSQRFSVRVMLGRLLLGALHSRGGTPGALSSLNHIELPLTVEVYRSVPYFPPSLCCSYGH